MILEQERRQAEAQWAAQEDQRLRAEFEREKARRAAEEAAIQREQEADRKRKMGEEEQRRRAQAALLLDRQKAEGPKSQQKHKFKEESYNIISKATPPSPSLQQNKAPVKRAGGIRLGEEIARANAEAAKAVEAAKAAIAAAAEAAAAEAAIAKVLQAASASKQDTTLLPPS